VVLAGAALGAPAAAQARSDGPPPRVMLRAPLDHQQSLVAHHRATRAKQLRGRAVSLKRKLDKVQGRKVRVKRERKDARKAVTPVLRHRVKSLQTKLAAARTPAPAAPTAGAPSPALQAIAACESGGNPATNTGNGFYGKYQFTQSTWASVGGTGNPAAASEAEQDARAAQLYAQQGSAPWPVCGQ
jgi:septal ring factor EnvC (AmiA/AmiB activator)